MRSPGPWILLIALLQASVARADTDTWRFKVLLDDKPIGYHTFKVTKEGDTQQVQIDVRFRVKFLFVTVYSYDLTDTEHWKDGCLRQISSKTRANGKTWAVEGSRDGRALEVKSEKNDETKVARLTDCVMTFAYWNPAMLKQSRLLNAQTGDYMDVDIKSLGSQTIEVQGEPVAARHYRLSADKLDIQLWYADGHWIQLASSVDGRTLRYELVSPLPADLRIAGTKAAASYP